MSEASGRIRTWESEIIDPEALITQRQMALFVNRSRELAAAAEIDPSSRNRFEGATNYELFGASVLVQITKEADNMDDGINRMAMLEVNTSTTEKNDHYQFFRTESLHFLVGYGVNARGKIIRGSYKRGFDKTEELFNASTDEYVASPLQLPGHLSETEQGDYYEEALQRDQEIKAVFGDTQFTQGRFVEAMRLMDALEAAKSMGQFAKSEPTERRSISISPEQRDFFEESVRDIIESNNLNGLAIHEVDDPDSFLVFLDSRHPDRLELRISRRVYIPNQPTLRLVLDNVYGIEPLATYSGSYTKVVSMGERELDDSSAREILGQASQLASGYSIYFDLYKSVKQWEADSKLPGAKAFTPAHFEDAMRTLHRLNPQTFHEKLTEAWLSSGF